MKNYLYIMLLLISYPLLAMENSEFYFPESQEELNDMVATKFEALVRDYKTQLDQAREDALENTNISNLKKGFWYANDYFDILSIYADEHGSKSAQKLLNYLKKRSHFLDGFADSNAPFIRRGKSFEYYLTTDDAAEAVMNIGKNERIFIDCAIAYQIAYYRVLIDIFSKDLFNHLINRMKKMPFLSYSFLDTYLQFFVNPTIGLNKNPQRGEFFYIRNHSLYCVKEKNGEAQGFNLIVKDFDENGEPLYLGLGLNPEGCTSEAIEQVLVNNFNKEPYNERIVTANKWTEIKPGGLYEELMNFLADKTIESINDENILEVVRDYVGGWCRRQGVPEAHIEYNIENFLSTLEINIESAVSPILSLEKIQAVEEGMCASTLF